MRLQEWLAVAGLAAALVLPGWAQEPDYHYLGHKINAQTFDRAFHYFRPYLFCDDAGQVYDLRDDRGEIPSTVTEITVCRERAVESAPGVRPFLVSHRVAVTPITAETFAVYIRNSPLFRCYSEAAANHSAEGKPQLHWQRIAPEELERLDLSSEMPPSAKPDAAPSAATEVSAMPYTGKDDDGDGFPNIYELLKHTDPHNPLSHPPLSDRLYVEKIARLPLGVKLKKIQVRGADCADWEIQLEIRVRKEWRTQFCRFGDTVKVGGMEYRMTNAAGKSDGSTVAEDRTEITLQPVGGGDKLVAVLGQPVVSPRETACLRDVVDGKGYRVEEGRNFSLGEVTTGTEKYQVIQLDGSQKIVRVQRESDRQNLEIPARPRFGLIRDADSTGQSPANAERIPPSQL